jgi:L-aminopeptidase/D-esterase-like protein
MVLSVTHAARAFFVMTMAGSITDVPGLRVGHYTDLDAATGCTVVLCERGAVPGVHVSGASPGGREIELL